MTIKDILKQSLPPDIYERAMYYCDCPDAEYVFGDALSSAFMWDSTTEGREYWQSINEKYFHVEDEPAFPFPKPRFRGLFRKERIIIGFLCDVDKINQDGIIYECEDIQQYVFSVGEFEFFTGDRYKGKIINYNHLTRQFCLGEEPLHDTIS
jgi:hypothetical protein